MRIILCTSVAVFFTSTFARAENVARLDETIVTARQQKDTTHTTPYSAHLISKEDFNDRRQVRGFVDALAETPGVMVQKTAPGQGSPFIRGFTGFRTLALVDGIRLNNAVFREGPNQYWSTIDALTVGQIEVVKGPGSVLYGSDSVGGTVNAISRSPIMLPWAEASQGKTVLDPKSPIKAESSVAIHPGAFYRYSTAEDSHTARADFSLAITPHFGVLGGVTWKEFGDLRGGDLIGDQPETGFSEINGDIKFLIRPTQDVDITAAFFRTEQNNVPRTHSTIFSKSFDGTAVGTDLRRDYDQIRELAYVQSEVRDLTSWLSNVKFSLSWQRQTEEQDRIRGNGRREVLGFQDDAFGLLLSAQSPTAIGTLNYGVEYYRDEVDSWGSDWTATGGLRHILPRGPVADDASYDLLGVYLQDTFKPVEKLEVTLGVRYSWARAKAGEIDPDPTDAQDYDSLNRSFDGLTGSLRLRYDVTDDWNFFGGVSQGFRAPNLSDFTSFDIARSGEQETPSPDLDEERYTSFEIGTKARVESLGLNLYAAYFHTLVDNQIVRYPTGRTIGGNAEVTRANVGDGYIHGVEFGASVQLPYGFNLFGNLTWTEGEIDTLIGNDIAARPASRIQPLTGLVGLRWDSPARKWWIEASAALVAGQDRLSPGDHADTQRIPPGGTHGYSVYSLRAGWNPTEQVKIFASLENVTDEDYRVLGSGTNEPGLNFIVGTKLQF